MDNYDWFAVMDRISVIQQTLEDSVGSYQGVGRELIDLIDSAQEKLAEAYQLAGSKLDEIESKSTTSGGPYVLKTNRK